MNKYFIVAWCVFVSIFINVEKARRKHKGVSDEFRDWRNNPFWWWLLVNVIKKNLYLKIKADNSIEKSASALKFATHNFGLVWATFLNNLDPLFREINKPCSSIIPMPILFRNEQYCQDVVYILEFYTNKVIDGYNKAGRQVTEETRILIGGDQLTRKRFPRAKAMRSSW